MKHLSWLIKYSITIFSCILQMVSVLTRSRTTEFDSLFYPAIHCLYCNPAGYPHGLLWYAIMIPIAWFGNITSTMMILSLITMSLLILFLRKNHIFIPFFICSFYNFFVIPQNLPVLWLMLLGFYSPYLLFLPIITKLPVGAPIPVWSFIFHTSLNITSNFQADYGVLVGFWMYILIYNLRFDIIRGWKSLTSFKY